MTNRERLLITLRREIPDCVPVMPDISNMVPARLTGKPFWDLYLYNDPPIWEAYLAAARYFDLDVLMDGYFPLSFPEEWAGGPPWERFIIKRTPERIITQASYVENGKRIWAPTVDVYYIADPPTGGLPPAKIGLPPEPESWEPLEGVKPVDVGPEGFRRFKEKLGNQGLIGAFVTYSAALYDEASIVDYYENPEKWERATEQRITAAEQRFARIMTMEEKPDFICVGGSGTLVFQTPEIFRKLAFPAVKRAIDLATEAGLYTHLHSCGPEKELVKIMAEESNLTIIDPLEIPPMGDCDLAELKRLYGDKLLLKGNLHTTQTMLYGSVEDVIAASKKAIDEGAEGGGFVLSTGDQCGRDTPFENLHAMVETARTYGKY